MNYLFFSFRQGSRKYRCIQMGENRLSFKMFYDLRKKKKIIKYLQTSEILLLANGDYLLGFLSGGVHESRF